MTHQHSESVLIPLTADEALVLFEFLQRFSSTDELTIEDQSEQRALWNLCCLFEKHLSVPFDANYTEILQAAQDRLRDDC
jgi:hypothetical protein